MILKEERISGRTNECKGGGSDRRKHGKDGWPKEPEGEKGIFFTLESYEPALS